MWTLIPIEDLEHERKFWAVVRENIFFTLETKVVESLSQLQATTGTTQRKKTSPRLTKSPRIGLSDQRKGGSDISDSVGSNTACTHRVCFRLSPLFLTIASSSSFVNIKPYWEAVVRIAEQLQEFEQETDDDLQMITEYLMIKLTALAKAEAVEHAESQRNADVMLTRQRVSRRANSEGKSKNKTSKHNYACLRPDDPTFSVLFDISGPLLRSFECCVWRNSCTSGRLYITPAAIAFQARLVKSHQLVIPFSEIKSMSSFSSTLPDSIRITSVTRPFIFSEIKDHLEVVGFLHCLIQYYHKHMKEQLPRRGRPRSRSVTACSVDDLIVLKKSAPARRSDSSLEVNPAGIFMSCPLFLFPTYPEVVHEEMVELCEVKFLSFPEQESWISTPRTRLLLARTISSAPKLATTPRSTQSRLTKSLSLPANEFPATVRLLVSPQYIGFLGWHQELSIIVPIESIEKIEEKDSELKDRQIELILSSDDYHLNCRCDLEVYGLIQQLKRALEVKASSIPEIKEKGEDPVASMSLAARFKSTISRAFGKGDTAWENYKTVNGWGICASKNSDLRMMARAGVPDAYKATFWQMATGSIYQIDRMRTVFKEWETKGRYQSNPFYEEIQGDVPRSLPEHPTYQTDEGKESLQRVLVAFADVFPEIGYCQSMNIFGAQLLLYLSEEETFCMLHSICSEILPEYYTLEMVGCLVDQEALRFLVETQLPDLYAHLEEIGVPLPLFAIRWFMCLYVGCLPTETSLRVLDWFFAEGSHVLFCVAFAILKLQEKTILETTEGVDVIELLRTNDRLKPHLIMNEAFGMVETLQISTLNNLREKVRPTVISDIEKLDLQDFISLSSPRFDTLVGGEANEKPKKSTSTPTSPVTPRRATTPAKLQISVTPVTKTPNREASVFQSTLDWNSRRTPVRKGLAMTMSTGKELHDFISQTRHEASLRNLDDLPEDNMRNQSPLRSGKGSRLGAKFSMKKAKEFNSRARARLSSINLIKSYQTHRTRITEG